MLDSHSLSVFIDETRKNTIYKCTGFIAAVLLCKLNGLVNGYLLRNILHKENFIETEPKDREVRLRHTVCFPAFDSGIDLLIKLRDLCDDFRDLGSQTLFILRRQLLHMDDAIAILIIR